MEAMSKATFLWCTLFLLLGPHHGNSTLSTNQATPVLLSAVNYRDVEVGPYDWRYFRVDLPVGFSSASVAWKKKWDAGNQASNSDELAPLVCFRFGGPPVPAPALESLMMAAIAAGRIQNMTDMGKCAIFQESVSFILSNQQVVSGVLHIGVFSDPNPTRTQSQMISRGNVYSFELQLQVFGCMSPLAHGVHCSVDVNNLGSELPLAITGSLFNQEFVAATHVHTNLNSSPNHSSNYAEEDKEGTTLQEKLVYLGSLDDGSWSTAANQCIKRGDWKFHALQVVDVAAELEFKLEQKSVSCNEGYVRYGALPQNTTTSYKLDVTSPLSITAPKHGRWYVGILSANAEGDESGQCCYTVSWRLQTCAHGRVGEGCTWNITTLERVLGKKVESLFDSNYRPMTSTKSNSNRFPVSLMLATTSTGTNLGTEAWAYFCLNVPQGAAGSVLSLDVIGPASSHFQLLARYEGVPTSDIWDYKVEQVQTVTGLDSGGSNSPILNHVKLMSLKLDIIYPAEGAWYIAVKSFLEVGTINSPIMYKTQDTKETNPQYPESDNSEDPTSSSFLTNQGDSVSWISDTTMRLGLHGCPGKCSGHGVCRTQYEESRLHVYSYCYCDRTHGGLDCSVEILGGAGQALHIIALVASNAAAALPSLWCLQHKVYSEWIVFTTSGLSSAIYHLCDAGGWCALSYSSLQFLDFWLSFLSVVITFVYMAAFLGSSKAAMHIGGAIFTAVIAKENATSAANVIIVMCIGAAGLLMGFALEFWRAPSATMQRTRWRIGDISSLPTFRWNTVMMYVRTSAGMLGARFRWLYVLVGVATLFAAKLSFFFETAESYWMWHSLWHVSIFTSALCFLKSRIMVVAKEAQLDEADPLLLDESRADRVPRKRAPTGGEAAELASFAEEEIELPS